MKTKFEKQIRETDFSQVEKNKAFGEGLKLTNERYTSVEFHMEDIKDKAKRAPEKWGKVFKDPYNPDTSILRKEAIRQLNWHRQHFLRVS